jgi:hypothetical protein
MLFCNVLAHYMGLRRLSEGKNLAADLGKAGHFSAMRVIQELGISAEQQ